MSDNLRQFENHTDAEHEDIEVLTAKDEYIDPDPIVARRKWREAANRLTATNTQWASVAVEMMAEEA